MKTKSARIANNMTAPPRSSRMLSIRMSRRASANKVVVGLSGELFFDLPSEDIQLNILSYLDIGSLQSWMQVSHAARDIALSAENSITVLWKPACQRQWPWLHEQLENEAFVKDALNVLPLHNKNQECANLPLLLSLAAKHKSTTIDESLFTPTHWSKVRRRHRPTRNAKQDLRFVKLHHQDKFQHQDSCGTSTTDDMTVCSMEDDRNVIHAVQFTGEVGGRNRSIRADQPLPCPQESVTVAKMIAFEKKQKSFWRRFCRSKSLLEDQIAADVQMWKPFVAPYTVLEKNHEQSVHLTPRLISYFEVTIMEPLPDEEEEEGQQQQRGRNNLETGECVAVGIATDDFGLVGRLPGWDQRSFGYHGDDGGAYHASGEMTSQFGPTFGVGDTVGCGIDYHHRGIFFTKNGCFLGYAFENVSFWMLNNPWFPVIGMDTRCLVSCNFGTRQPFQYNLNKMVMDRQQKIITKTILPDESKKSSKKKKLLSW